MIKYLLESKYIEKEIKKTENRKVSGLLRIHSRKSKKQIYF